MSVRDTLVNIIIKAKDLGSKPIKRFERTLNGLDNTVTRVAAGLAAFFSVRAAVGFFKDAVTGAASFEEQMSKVEAVSGATAEEMAALTEEAKRLGRETVFTATEAGEGLEILARAGLSASEQIAALSPVLNTAQAEGIGLAEAAGYVTDTLSIYNLEAADSARVSDLFAKGASIANTSIGDLGQALREAGGLAKGSNITLEGTVAILDQLANNGLRGSKAGVALKGILAQLADPASKSRKELKKLGIDTGDLAEVIKGLEQAGDDGKAAMLAFGTEALPAIQALTNGGSKAIAGFTEKLNEAEGAAAKMAKTATNNLNGALKGLGSAFDGIKQQLSGASLPVFTEQVKDLTAYFQELAGDGSVERFGKQLADMFRDAGARLKTFLGDFDFSSAIDKTGEFVRDLVNKFETAGHWFGIFTNGVLIASNTVAAGVKTVGGAISFLLYDLTAGISNFLRLVGADDMSRKAELMAEGFRDAAKGFKDGIIEDSADIVRNWEEMQSHVTAISRLESEKRARIAEKESEAIVKSSEDAAAALAEVQAELQSTGSAGEQAATQIGQAFDTALADINNGADLAQFKAELSAAWSDGKIAADDYVRLMGEAKKKTVELGQATDTAVGGNAKSWKALADTMQEAREAREQARAAQDKDTESHTKETEAIDGVVTSYGDFKDELGSADTRSKLLTLRAALVRAFDDGKMSVEDFNASMDALGNKLDEVKNKTRKFAVTLAGESAAAFGQMSAQMQAYSEKLFDSIKGAGWRLHDSWWRAERSMQSMLDTYRKQEGEVDKITKALTSADRVTEGMVRNAEEAAQGMNLLGDQQLRPLRSALDSARQKIASLKDETSGTLAALKDELDGMNDNYEAIEQRGYQARRAELQALIDEANRAGSSDALQDAQQSLTLLDRIHKQKMEGIRAEREERQRYEADSKRQAGESQRQPSSDSGSSKTIRLQLAGPDGSETAVSLDSEADVDRILRLLQQAGLSSL